MRPVAAAFAVLLAACSSGPESGPTAESQAGVGETMPDPQPPRGPQPAVADSGAPDAPAASACAELGQSCLTTDDCFCGLGAGCAWDNVACSSGHTCVVASAIPSGTGSAEWQCCGGCESTYQACTGAGCMAAWQTCNATCGLPSACPARCSAH